MGKRVLVVDDDRLIREMIRDALAEESFRVAAAATGWDEKALHDVIMVGCCYAFMNRLADGHGLPSDPSMFKERGRRHMEHGYVAQYAEETASEDD